MISNQIIQNCMDELKAITKVDLSVYDSNGNSIATTETMEEKGMTGIVRDFVKSPADSQVMGNHHLLKIRDDGEETQFIVDAFGTQDDAYMIGKIAASELGHLMSAYRERFDRTGFYQNLLLDNLLLIDIHNRAKRLHIMEEQSRVVFVIESRGTADLAVEELLKGMFSAENGDYVVSVEESNIVLIKTIRDENSEKEIDEIAKIIPDMINTEAMINVKVASGSVVRELKDISGSYKEAKMALEVGRIFYPEKDSLAYRSLGIGRLIYQLPTNLCNMFLQEIFGKEIPEELDEETLITVDKFLENNLNISETSRQLFIHRNTLVYRIEKLMKATGLDIRIFEDALTLKVALMVESYLKYLRER